MTPEQFPTISWQAPEFKHYEKNPGWYITLATIAVLLIGYQVVQRDIFGAISIIIFFIFIVIFAMQRPKDVTVSLTHKGLMIDELHIPYKTIKHFWVVHNDNHKTLNLETTAYLNSTIILELENQDPETVRLALIKVLPEHKETDETFAQRIMHRLKF